jgi:hypothetical protein
VVAGSFTIAGSVQASNIAVHDPATGAWYALGAGTNGEVFSLTARSDGSLVAGGAFTTAGGATVNRVARWNGTAWSAFGTGITGNVNMHVNALAEDGNGNLVAGGWFFTAGGQSVSCIARWNGSAWAGLGSGAGGEVLCLARLANGDIVAGGVFPTAGGVSVNGIARWNGSSWAGFGSGFDGGVFSLKVLSGGQVVAGGTFTSAGGLSAGRVARWNGTSWQALGTGIVGQSDYVYALEELPNGDIVAAGDFYAAGGATAYSVARWDGVAWSAMRQGLMTRVKSLTTMSNGNLVAGGDFNGTATGWLSPRNLALWDGVDWSAYGDGIAGTVHAVGALPHGDLVVGGSFMAVDGVQAHGVSLKTPGGWVALGQGVEGQVLAISVLSNGDIIAGGEFAKAGGVTAPNVARWDGIQWSPLGAGVNGAVRALAELPNGDLVAGGSFTSAGGVAASRIARWNGSVWLPIGSGTSDVVRALAALPNGDLVVGGDFTAAGGVAASRIALWNGSVWSALGAGVAYSSWGSPHVDALAVLPNGDLMAGGFFDRAGGVTALGLARWSAGAWSQVGYTGSCYSLLVLPNGQLVAGGQSIQRWNGTTWLPVSSHTLGGVSGFRVNGLASTTNGDLIAGGSFLTVGSQVSACLARFAPTCPALATPYGIACVGSAGPVTLVADNLPWAGSTFRATASGMAPGSLAFGLHSFLSAATPLAALHPAGGVGCDLLVSPDVAVLLLPVGGSVTSTLGIPTSPAFLGAVVRNQVVQIELDPTASITAITSSNGLVLTFGAL